MTALARFYTASAEEAMTSLLACCGSHAWASNMVARRHGAESPRAHPYSNFLTADAVLQAASDLWFALPEPDWLEAFACHPRIGEATRADTGFLAHSISEQLATQQTLSEVAAHLHAQNRAYEAKFGFLYIVFASGRTAPELLAVLEQRLRNTRADELQEAARQQDRITRLRLERWLTA